MLDSTDGASDTIIARRGNSTPMDIRDHNREAWNHCVDTAYIWTVPARPEQIAAARQGKVEIILTPTRPVPADWLGSLPGKDVLCLASGGGQQGPLLAAAGANVTVFDNSPRQLDQDRFVAQRDGLQLATVEGDMRDLSAFDAESFDLVVHPISNIFVPDILPVWREAFRVLRRGGSLLSGITSPFVYLFDYDEVEKTGQLVVRHKLPYSDVDLRTPEERRHMLERGAPLEFSHTLEEQIGGQIQAGFVLTGFYEDFDRPEWGDPLTDYMASSFATRAFKP